MHRFKHILGVIDARRAADTMLERAVALADSNRAALTVVAVAPQVIAGIGMPEGGPISADLQAAAVADAQQRLEDAVAPFRSRTDIATRVLVGTVFLELIREVLRGGHDLLIKAPEDPDWLTRLFGSDDMHLLRKCPCPVWLVKPAPAAAYRRIVAAVDVAGDQPAAGQAVCDALNVQIVELAMSLAAMDGAELHVAHACEARAAGVMRGEFLHRADAEVEDYIAKVCRQRAGRLDQLLEQVIRSRGGNAAQPDVRCHTIKGAPRKLIPALASELAADLVVMGTVARIGIAGFLIGNTAETMLEQLQCSVLAVKPQGFVTPVTLDQRPDR